MIKYCLLGCGKRSRFFFRRLGELGCKPAMVYDPCKSKTKFFEEQGAKVAESADEAISYPSEFIAICTMAHKNASIISKAMCANLNILAEKPIAQTFEDIRKIKVQLGNYSGVLQITNQENADARYDLARKIIEDGGIGELAWANASWCRNNEALDWHQEIDPAIHADTVTWEAISSKPFDAMKYARWRNFWEFSGGLITDSIYHKLPPLMNVFDADPVRVVCHGNGGEANREVPTTVFVGADFEDFSLTLVGSNKSSFEQPDMIRGNRGAITFLQDPAWTVPPPKSLMLSVESRYGGETKIYDNCAGSVDVFENFINVLRGQEQQLNSGVEPNLRASLICAAAVKSFRNTKYIVMDDTDA